MTADVYINDAGTARRTRQIYVNDNGVARRIKEIWVNDSRHRAADLRQRRCCLSQLVRKQPPATGSHSTELNSDGTCTTLDSQSGTKKWINPQGGMWQYEVFATQSSSSGSGSVERVFGSWLTADRHTYLVRQ
jgi:hypothetical protein